MKWQRSKLKDRRSKIVRGKLRDQRDAKWIVIRRSLWGHNDTSCGWPAPGWPIRRPLSVRPQGVFGGLSYYQSVIFFITIVPLIVEFTNNCIPNVVSTQMWFRPECGFNWSGSHDQADAEWIVVRRLLMGHNNTPFKRPTLVGLSTAQGLATLRAHFAFSVTIISNVNA
jgi:hypothetical protein